MLSRSYFDTGVEVGELLGTIDSVSLEAMDPDHVFVEGDIVRNIYWLGLL